MAAAATTATARMKRRGFLTGNLHRIRWGMGEAGRREFCSRGSLRSSHNRNPSFCGSLEQRLAVEEQRAAGFDGEATGAGADHRLDRRNADDRNVEAHVRIR